MLNTRGTIFIDLAILNSPFNNVFKILKSPLDIDKIGLSLTLLE